MSAHDQAEETRKTISIALHLKTPGILIEALIDSKTAVLEKFSSFRLISGIRANCYELQKQTDPRVSVSELQKL